MTGSATRRGNIQAAGVGRNAKAHRKKGAADFYQGETAQMLVRDMAAMGGLITMDDLAHYQPKIREVIHANYTFDGHKWEVLSAPPPSSGGVAVIEALNMLQDVPLKGWDDPQSVHMVVEVMRQSVCGSRGLSGGPGFFQCAGGGIDGSLLCERTRGDD